MMPDRDGSWRNAARLMKTHWCGADRKYSVKSSHGTLFSHQSKNFFAYKTLQLLWYLRTRIRHIWAFIIALGSIGGRLTHMKRSADNFISRTCCPFKSYKWWIHQLKSNALDTKQQKWSLTGILAVLKIWMSNQSRPGVPRGHPRTRGRGGGKMTPDFWKTMRDRKTLLSIALNGYMRKYLGQFSLRPIRRSPQSKNVNF